MAARILGTKELKDALNGRIGKDLKQAVIWAMYTEALSIIRKAARKAPVDTGRLRASHFVQPPKANDKVIEFGFGTEYAQRQNYEHKMAHGYFTDSIKEARPGLLDRIAATAHRLWKSKNFTPNGSEPQSLGEAESKGLSKQRRRGRAVRGRTKGVKGRV